MKTLLKKAYIKTEDGLVIIGDTSNFDSTVVNIPLYHPSKGYNQTLVGIGRFIEFICEDDKVTVDGSLEFKHIK